MSMRLKFLSVILISCLIFGCFCEVIVLEQNTLNSGENLSSSGSTNDESTVTAGNQDQLVFHDTTLIQDEKGYFYIELLSSNYSVLAKVLDQNLDHTDIQINKQHPVIYIDSFKNFILVKQVDNTTQTKKQQGNGNVTLQSLVAYYVYSIERSVEEELGDQESVQNAQERPKFYARQRLVNASFDSSSFPIPQGYVLTQILQVDEVNSIMYVVMKGLLSQTTVIYQINLRPYQPQLNMFSWFMNQNLNKIKGNSRVIADIPNNQLLIQQNSPYNSAIEQTSYVRKSFSDLTTLNLSSNLMKVIQMYGSSFLIVSLDSDKNSLNGFLYQGYGEEEKVKQISLRSTTSLKMFYDRYSYGIYVGSDDLVWVQVGKDKKTQKDISSVTRLSNKIKDSSVKNSILNDFQQATQIFYINNEAHLITSKKYIVYSNKDFTLTKIYEENLNYLESIQSSQQTLNTATQNPYDMISNNRILLQLIQSYKQRSN